MVLWGLLNNKVYNQASDLILTRLAELSSRTFCTFRRELSSRRRTIAPSADEEWSGVGEQPMIIPNHDPSRQRWWRSLKHQWLFLHPLDSVTAVRRLVEFYVHEHNRVLPHSAFRGQTPDEMYFGTGDAVPGDLTSRAAAARRARVEANRSAACETYPSIDEAA
jgi:hypothetical protein